MTLRYSYSPYVAPNPVISLGGRAERPRPVIPVALIGPGGSVSRDGLLDTGADDTVFPAAEATLLGLDLSTAPTGIASGVGTIPYPVRYARVRLRITDGQERREWEAWVGFTAARLRRPLLGYAGFLQFFGANFLEDAEVVELTVNGKYPGT